jgi:hypothetical protein
MASSTAIHDQPAAGAAARGSVLFYLRLEGLAVATVSAVLFARTGASWWLFAGLWLVPDLSMLGYLKSPCWGARIYNAVHSYVVPAALGLSAVLLHANNLLPIALIWVNHIGVDRLMGYGLKYADGFGWTHLGRLGKRPTATAENFEQPDRAATRRAQPAKSQTKQGLP